jgi:hypothetical protein
MEKSMGVKLRKKKKIASLRKEYDENLSEVKSGTFYEGDTSKKISKAQQRQQASADIEKSGEYREKFEKKRGSKRRRKKALRLFKKKQRL